MMTPDDNSRWNIPAVTSIVGVWPEARGNWRQHPQIFIGAMGRFSLFQYNRLVMFDGMLNSLSFFLIIFVLALTWVVTLYYSHTWVIITKDTIYGLHPGSNTTNSRDTLFMTSIGSWRFLLLQLCSTKIARGSCSWWMEFWILYLKCVPEGLIHCLVLWRGVGAQTRWLNYTKSFQFCLKVDILWRAGASQQLLI